MNCLQLIVPVFNLLLKHRVQIDFKLYRYLTAVPSKVWKLELGGLFLVCKSNYLVLDLRYPLINLNDIFVQFFSQILNSFDSLNELALSLRKIVIYLVD